MKQNTPTTKVMAKALCLLLLCQSFIPLSARATTASTPKPTIQIALLLDTSSSMDGLIAQAKTQLWNIVKELSTANYKGAPPTMEIALYQYGNDGLPQSAGYIQQISAFTGDLDKISDELFKLRTNGGNEYCPQAIVHACSTLQWRQDEGNLRLLFIAGNEPFAQGSITPEQACNAALAKRVSVTTIHCGPEESGRLGGWDKLPSCTEGKYLCINGDYQQRYISTPYDSTILNLNTTLNSTYIPYGTSGSAGFANQARQDYNSSTVASANMVERAVAKSSNFYMNSSWDFIDAVTDNKIDLFTASTDDLPESFRSLNTEQRKKKFEELKSQRSTVQKEINSLEQKRQEYIQQEEKKSTEANGAPPSLQQRILSVVRELAVKRGFNFNK